MNGNTSKLEILPPEERIAVLSKRLSNLEARHAHTNAIKACGEALRDALVDLLQSVRRSQHWEAWH